MCAPSRDIRRKRHAPGIERRPPPAKSCETHDKSARWFGIHFPVLVSRDTPWIRPWRLALGSCLETVPGNEHREAGDVAAHNGSTACPGNTRQPQPPHDSLLDFAPGHAPRPEHASHALAPAPLARPARRASARSDPLRLHALDDTATRARHRSRTDAPQRTEEDR